MKKSPTLAGTSRRRSRRDHGASFVEVLVSVVLIGTSGVAVLAAVGAAAFGAATHRSVAEAQAAVSTAADEITAGSIAFQPCALPDDYARHLSPDLGVDVVAVQYWRAGAWDTTCDVDADTLQLVTLQASSGERGVATLRAVKRSPSDPDADYVMNQDAGGAPVVPTEPTPGIDGTTVPPTTVPPTTVPPTTVPPTTVPPTTVPPTTVPPTTVPPTTVPPTTVPPGQRPTCEVDRIRVDRWWRDSIVVVVENDGERTFESTDWYVRLRYAGVGVEQNGHYVSTWDGDVLTLAPAQRWLRLRADSERRITVLEPGGSLRGLDDDDIDCEVVVR